MTFESPYWSYWSYGDPCAQPRGYDHVGAPVASFLDSLSDFDGSTGNPIRLPSGYLPSMMISNALAPAGILALLEAMHSSTSSWGPSLVCTEAILCFSFAERFAGHMVPCFSEVWADWRRAWSSTRLWDSTGKIPRTQRTSCHDAISLI